MQMSLEFSDRNQANKKMERQDETAISKLVWKSDEELETQIREEFEDAGYTQEDIEKSIAEIRTR